MYVHAAPAIRVLFARQRRFRRVHLQNLVVGHVRIRLLDGVLEEGLFEAELRPLVDDIDTLFVERQYSHTADYARHKYKDSLSGGHADSGIRWPSGETRVQNGPSGPLRVAVATDSDDLEQGVRRDAVGCRRCRVCQPARRRPRDCRPVRGSRRWFRPSSCRRISVVDDVAVSVPDLREVPRERAIARLALVVVSLVLVGASSPRSVSSSRATVVASGAPAFSMPMVRSTSSPFFESSTAIAAPACTVGCCPDRQQTSRRGYRGDRRRRSYPVPCRCRYDRQANSPSRGRR